MKTSGLRGCALFVGCVAIVACSQTTELSRFPYTPNVDSARDRGDSPLSYGVLHSFGAPPDGNYPFAGVIRRRGTFYGTTTSGGAYPCGSRTCGTVFSITAGGTEKVLYSFRGGSDGDGPTAGLVNVDGTLYGTTESGGSYHSGTVFSITAGGTEKVLHSFGAGSDGRYPFAGLIDVKGILYGTTLEGGTYTCRSRTCGTIFSITIGGTETVLHSFGAGSDGYYPIAGLVDVRGTLYGTTFYGGTYASWGTVFSITTGGVEKVLHSFNGTDGIFPAARLVNVGGILYGTTSSGGAYHCGRGVDCGTVFSITTGGTQKTLHIFGNGNDGSDPEAGLIDVGGTLYGTTFYGGDHTGGTAFSITTSGTETVLPSFGGGTDGFYPEAGVTYDKRLGNLIGTTEDGGSSSACSGGCGAVFSLTP